MHQTGAKLRETVLMTLVVAKKYAAGDIAIISDIKLTGPNGEQLPPKNGALKTWMPAQDLSFSFAGNADAPVELWGEIKNRFAGAGIDWLEILQATQGIARKYSGAGSKGAEFIVAMARGDGSIAKVTAEEILQNQETCWIGDIKAFECFQHHFLSSEAVKMNELRARTAWAFKQFIANGGVESAGHFEFSVSIQLDANSRPFFNYDLGCSTISGLAPRTTHVKAGEWTTLTLGDAKDGVCSVSKVRSHPGEYTGTGLYFSEARFGFFFCPALGIDSLILHEVEAQEFVRLISEKIGVSVQGLISSGTHIQMHEHP